MTFTVTEGGGFHCVIKGKGIVPDGTEVSGSLADLDSSTVAGVITMTGNLTNLGSPTIQTLLATADGKPISIVIVEAAKTITVSSGDPTIMGFMAGVYTIQ
jgi:hypothetical protein